MVDYHFDGKKLRLTEEEWKERLTPEQFKVLRHAGTECAFQNAFFDMKRKGLFSCVGCGLPLFSTSSKFDSGTGWPSFFQPIAPENVTYKKDESGGYVRIEVCCSRCGGHLGHVFEDGPAPTGQRYCMNSAAMEFQERE